MYQIANYKNGNVKITIFEDGTRIMETEDDEFEFEMPISVDMKITNSCDRGCSFCHENSVVNGKHADIKNLNYLTTFLPYTEVAIGGGNVLEHPDVDWLLNTYKEKNIISNITVNQVHFLKEFDRIKEWVDKGLVKGVGVSLVERDNNLIEKVKQIPNAVIHVIAGIFNEEDFNFLRDNNLNILILGYKTFRRGVTFKTNHSEEIERNRKWLSENLSEVVKGFRAIAFDNLGVAQIPVQEYMGEAWEDYFQGDDGTNTFYIDAVNERFAVSSSTSKTYPLKNTVKEMFEIIKSLR